MEDPIIKIQEKLKAPKGQYNDFGGYSYRSCEDILEALKPMLADEGLRQTISDEIVEIGGRVYVKATVTIKKDGEQVDQVTAYARESESKKGMDSAQITGSASSYARKYALNGMWLIDDLKDADTEEQDKQKRNRGGSQNSSSEKEWLNKTEYQSDEITKKWENATKAIRAGKYTAQQIIDSYQMKKELKDELRNIEQKVNKNGQAA
jgi:hypothetical protein